MVHEQPTATWHRVATAGTGPGARSSHGLSVVGEKLWLIGGEKRAREPAGMTAFSLDLGGWEAAGGQPLEWTARLPDEGRAPVSRVAHAQAALGPHIYVFAGRQGVDEEVALGDFWRFDTATGAWEEVAGSGDVPEARSYHAACAAGGKLYVFGGCGAGGRLADLHEFDPATGAWTRLPDPPGLAGRGGPTLEAVDGGAALLLFSGFPGKESKDCLLYRIADRAWEVLYDPAEGAAPKAGAPPGSAAAWGALEPRSVCASFAVGGGHGVVVVGGEVAPSSLGHAGAGGFTDEVLLLDSAGDLRHVEVAGADGLPAPRGWGAACAISGAAGLVFGGLTGTDEDPTRLGDCWVLQLEGAGAGPARG